MNPTAEELFFVDNSPRFAQTPLLEMTHLLKNSSPASLAKNRVVFIDQMRAIAIGMMLFGHTMQHYLAEPWRSSEAWQRYQFVRGVTSTLFLLVSGFSFAVATYKHWGDYLTWSKRLGGRLRRVWLLFFLGYFLNIWAPTLSQSLSTANPERIERFLGFGILQNVGVGLLLLHILVATARTKARFVVLCAFALAIILVSAPLTYSSSFHSAAPGWVTAMLNMHGRSLFPVVPWTGYMLVGVLFGHAFAIASDDVARRRVFVVASLCALALFGWEALVRSPEALRLFPYAGAWPNTPGFFFARLACALLVMSGLYALGRKAIVAPKLSLALSRETLFIYFFHIYIVYSVPRLLKGPFAPSEMHPLAVLPFVAFLVAAMVGAAFALGWARKHHPVNLALLRRGLILSGLAVFFFIDRFTWTTAAVSCAVCFACLLAYNRRAKPKGQTEAPEMGAGQQRALGAVSLFGGKSLRKRSKLRKKLVF